MSKHNPPKNIETEKELRHREEDDGIPFKKRIHRHPHEILAPVGETFIPEELEEQGYTEEGLGTPDNEDRALTNPDQGQKVA